MGASLSVGQWPVHFSTADSSTIPLLPGTGRDKKTAPQESVRSETKAFSAKRVTSPSSSGTHPHPPLMYMLDIIGTVPAIEQIANPLVYAAKSRKVLTRQLFGRQEEKNGEALWMEREFHLDFTGIFLSSLSKPGRLIKTGLPSCCRPQSLAPNKLLIKGECRGRGGDLV